jgi:hypothetical protein
VALYNPDRHWRCRSCTHVTYASSNASDARISRLLRAGPAAIDRLDPGLPDPAWDASELARWLRRAASLLTLQLKEQQRTDQRIERGHQRG